jgi:ribosome-binding protein aMBF1 (putative translation factor)
MSTQSNIKDRFNKLLSSKTEEERLKRDANILMASYLSEIERLYNDKGLNRKELAEKISISPSYLTQVFTGAKPLNFLTLAKIKRALNIKFTTTAEFITERKTAVIIDFDQFSATNNTRLKLTTTTDSEGLEAKYMGEELVRPLDKFISFEKKVTA